MAIRLFGRVLSLGALRRRGDGRLAGAAAQREAQDGRSRRRERAPGRGGAGRSRSARGSPAPDGAGRPPRRRPPRRAHLLPLPRRGRQPPLRRLARARARGTSARARSRSRSPPRPREHATDAEPREPRRAAERRPRPFERAASLPAARQPVAAAGVVVYTTSWCGWCRKTLAWLDERGVDVREPRHRGATTPGATSSSRRPAASRSRWSRSTAQIVRGYDPGRMGELL